jgi:hypothetical protein
MSEKEGKAKRLHSGTGIDFHSWNKLSDKRFMPASKL